MSKNKVVLLGTKGGPRMEKAPDVVTHPRDSARTGYMLALTLIKTDESNAAMELLLEIDDELETPCAANPDNGDLEQIRRMCRELSEKKRSSLP